MARPKDLISEISQKDYIDGVIRQGGKTALKINQLDLQTNHGKGYPTREELQSLNLAPLSFLRLRKSSRALASVPGGAGSDLVPTITRAQIRAIPTDRINNETHILLMTHGSDMPSKADLEKEVLALDQIARSKGTQASLTLINHLFALDQKMQCGLSNGSWNILQAKLSANIRALAKDPLVRTQNQRAPIIIHPIEARIGAKDPRYSINSLVAFDIHAQNISYHLYNPVAPNSSFEDYRAGGKTVVNSDQFEQIIHQLMAQNVEILGTGCVDRRQWPLSYSNRENVQRHMGFIANSIRDSYSWMTRFLQGANSPRIGQEAALGHSEDTLGSLRISDDQKLLAFIAGNFTIPRFLLLNMEGSTLSLKEAQHLLFSVPPGVDITSQIPGLQSLFANINRHNRGAQTYTVNFNGSYITRVDQPYRFQLVTTETKLPNIKVGEALVVDPRPHPNPNIWLEKPFSKKPLIVQI